MLPKKNFIYLKILLVWRALCSVITADNYILIGNRKLRMMLHTVVVPQVWTVFHLWTSSQLFSVFICQFGKKRQSAAALCSYFHFFPFQLKHPSPHYESYVDIKGTKSSQNVYIELSLFLQLLRSLRQQTATQSFLVLS